MLANDSFLKLLPYTKPENNNTLPPVGYYLLAMHLEKNVGQPQPEYPDSYQQAEFFYEKALGTVDDKFAGRQAIYASAKDGHPLAQFILGRCYLLGQGGLKRNKHLAEIWLQKAHGNDFAAASNLLGELEKDPVETLSYFEAAANTITCACLIDNKINNGIKLTAVEKYYNKNSLFFNILGDAYVDYNLACAKLDKANTQDTYDTSLTEGIFFLEAAAEKGCLEAHCKLGLIYLNGEYGITPNLDKAKEYIIQVAAWGDTPIQSQIKSRWQLPAMQDLTKVEQAVFDLFEQAAQLGVSEAQFQLGRLHYLGLLGLPVNDETAKLWFKKAAAQDHAKATYTLGAMHAHKRGGLSDLTQAVHYWQKALTIENDLILAQYNLAHAFRMGAGCKPNLQRAIALFQELHEKNFTLATLNLGLLYIKEDHKKAEGIDLLEIAAAQGEKEAINKLEELNIPVTTRHIKQKITFSQLEPSAQSSANKSAKTAEGQNPGTNRLTLYGATTASGSSTSETTLEQGISMSPNQQTR